MNRHNPDSGGGREAIRDAAARWVVKRDRGLSQAETSDYQRWLNEDPRHAAAIARATAAWNILERVPARIARPIAAKCGRRIRRIPRGWYAIGGMAAAAVFAVINVTSWRPFQSAPGPIEPVTGAGIAAASPKTMVLPDGTYVRLNVGAEVHEQFTASTRGVHLVRGEAHFTVTSDPERPFEVHAGDVTVRAVGTAFSVHLQPQGVDVLVTEGTVRVDAPAAMDGAGSDATSVDTIHIADEAASPARFVVAGQRAVVAPRPAAAEWAVTIYDVVPAEIARALAWREPLLRLGGATLAELASQFERQTGRRLILADSSLGAMRIGGRFPSDDVEGFVRVLEENYGIKSNRAPDGTISLSR